MSKIHVVQQGECLSSIAALYRYADYRAIYEHASNDALRKKRPNPDVLFPGDEVALPDPAVKKKEVRTNARHAFTLKRPKSFLRLNVLAHTAGEGVQARYELGIDGVEKPLEGTIGADGKLDVEVPISATRAELRLLELDTDEIIDVICLRLGELDPETTLSGVQSRLRKLGFNCGEEDGDMGPLTSRALAVFQQVYEIDEAGEVGPKTQAKLVELGGV